MSGIKSVLAFTAVGVGGLAAGAGVGIAIGRAMRDTPIDPAEQARREQEAAAATAEAAARREQEAAANRLRDQVGRLPVLGTESVPVAWLTKSYLDRYDHNKDGAISVTDESNRYCSGNANSQPAYVTVAPMLNAIDAAAGSTPDGFVTADELTTFIKTYDHGNVAEDGATVGTGDGQISGKSAKDGGNELYHLLHNAGDERGVR